MKRLFFAIVLGAFMLPSFSAEYMKVSPERIVDGANRCYKIKPGYSRKDKSEWVNFCGEFTNFYYVQGFEYTIYVEKYDPSLDSIRVIKTIARDNSEAYMKQLELKKKREARSAAKAAEEGK